MDNLTLPMRGNYYAEGEYATTNVATGVMRNRAGTRLCALTSDFLLGFRNAINYECGDAAPIIFKSCGRKWGLRFAAGLDREWSAFYGIAVADMPLAQFEACLVEAFSHHGWGKLRLDFTGHDKGVIVATVGHAVFGSIVGGTGKSEESMLAGVLAGVFSHFSGQTLDALQTACLSRGAPESRFVVALESRLAAAEDWVGAKSHDQIVADLAKIQG